MLIHFNLLERCVCLFTSPVEYALYAYTTCKCGIYDFVYPRERCISVHVVHLAVLHLSS